MVLGRERCEKILDHHILENEDVLDSQKGRETSIAEACQKDIRYWETKSLSF